MDLSNKKRKGDKVEIVDYSTNDNGNTVYEIACPSCKRPQFIESDGAREHYEVGLVSGEVFPIFVCLNPKCSFMKKIKLDT